MDIYEKIRVRYYDAPDHGIKKPREPVKPQWAKHETKAQHIAAVEAYEQEMARYAADLAAYNEAEKRRRKLQDDLYDEWKRDFFEHLGIVGNPKAERLYEVAYDRGHSAGYSEVLSAAEDMVDLIR